MSGGAASLTGGDASGVFAARVQTVAPLALLIRSLPAWSETTGLAVTVTARCRPGLDGVALEFGFSSTPSPDQFDDLLARMTATSRLMELQAGIDIMTEAGADAEAIERVVVAAEEALENLKPSF